MRVVIDDGGRCVCRAVAIATERPYQEIFDRLKALMELEGPRRRSGVEEFVQHKLMEALGWDLRLSSDQAQHWAGRSVTATQRSRATTHSMTANATGSCNSFAKKI